MKRVVNKDNLKKFIDLINGKPNKPFKPNSEYAKKLTKKQTKEMIYVIKNTPSPNKPNNKWEKEFDKNFPQLSVLTGKIGSGREVLYDFKPFVKDFISKTLQQQRKDLIKEIEGIKRLPNMAQNQNGNEYCSACGCPWDNIDNYCPDCATHNQALVDIIKILEKK